MHSPTLGLALSSASLERRAMVADNGCTPLHLAVAAQDTDMVELLLTAGIH